MYPRVTTRSSKSPAKRALGTSPIADQRLGAKGKDSSPVAAAQAEDTLRRWRDIEAYLNVHGPKLLAFCPDCGRFGRRRLTSQNPTSGSRDTRPGQRVQIHASAVSVAAFCGAKKDNPFLRNVLLLYLGTVKTRQLQMLSAAQGKYLPKVPHGL
jgi:hypothetical protein